MTLCLIIVWLMQSETNQLFLLISALNAMKHVPTQEMNLPRFRSWQLKSPKLKGKIIHSKRNTRNRGFYQMFSSPPKVLEIVDHRPLRPPHFSVEGLTPIASTWPLSQAAAGGRCETMAASNSRSDKTTCCNSASLARPHEDLCNVLVVPARLIPNHHTLSTDSGRSSFLKPCGTRRPSYIELELYRNPGSTLQFQDPVEWCFMKFWNLINKYQ